ncbi:hypothetical protein HRbin16_00596 [bacterium HR16]|nr:hypothetical protein HRbin16_00596 [bacterium HR16]
MLLRGIVRGNTIEVAEPLNLPEGSKVEVDIRPLVADHNPFWGIFHDYDQLLEDLEQQIMKEREQSNMEVSPWRSA